MNLFVAQFALTPTLSRRERESARQQARPPALHELALWLAEVVLLLLACTALADVPVPPLAHRVTDLTGTLSAEQKTALESRLAAFEQHKGSQIAILLVPTTQPETIEQYSIRAVETWKLGRKGVDDGVLILLAKDDHHSRIEVGYGLEGVLPDVIAKRILSDVMRPYFKQGDFYGGLLAGVDKIEAVIGGEPLPEPQRHSTKNFDASLIFAVFVAAIVVGGLLRAMLGSFTGGLLNGGLVALLLWALGAGLMFALFLGVMAFFMTLSGRGGFPGGFGGMGSGGWGGSGGGGFSGGGGGFGGGGASGNW